MTASSTGSFVAPALVGAARVALGVFWLLEGLLKYRAGFGASDILLVADGAQTNTRVPGYFSAFAEATMRQVPGLFGFAIPLLETTLGVVLVLGLFTRVAAVVSVLTLLLYWSSDQLIWQYPVMAALSVVVVMWPAAARRFSVSMLAENRMPALKRAPVPLRVWL